MSVGAGSVSKLFCCAPEAAFAVMTVESCRSAVEKKENDCEFPVTERAWSSVSVLAVVGSATPREVESLLGG
jgi:hypothetical protein